MALSNDDKKAARERRVFEEFASVAGMPLVNGSVQSRPPPEPDILCEIEGRGAVAFELVELVDQGWAHQTNLMLRTRRSADAYFTAAGAGAGFVALRDRFHDAMLGLEFEPVPVQDREASYEHLVQFLLTQPEDISEHDLELPTHLRATYRRVAVIRGMADGPWVDVASMSRLGDPTLDRIHTKLFDKSYGTNHPIELLAYTDGVDLLMPLDTWVPKNQPHIRAMQARGRFKRVWVYHASDVVERRALKLCEPAQ